MKIYNISAGILLLTVLMTRPAQAQVFSESKVITTAVPSLLVPADIRAAGMGEAGIATMGDANSIYTNLAKLPFANNKTGVGASYVPWLSDVSSGMFLAGVSGYHQLKGNHTLSASVRYFKMGTYQIHDNEGDLLGNTNPSELLLDIGYARKLSNKFALGLTLRYIHSDISTGSFNNTTYKAGSGIAGDIALMYNNRAENGEGFSAGLTLANLGSKIGYDQNSDVKDFIPAKLGAGVAYNAVISEKSSLLLAADLNKLMVPEVGGDALAYSEMGVAKSWGKSFGNNAYRGSFGAEYHYAHLFSLRAGYVAESLAQGGRQGLTAGAGIEYKNIAFDVAYLGATGDDLHPRPVGNSFKFGVLVGLK